MRQGASADTFHVERLARLLGFEQLSVRLTGDERYAPYMFVGTVLLVDVPVLNTVNLTRGYPGSMGSPWWEWPGAVWWLIPVVVLLGVYLLRALRTRYQTAASAVGSEDEPVFDTAMSSRLQYGMLIVGTVVFIVWLSSTLGFFYGRAGVLVGSVKWFLIVPLFYNPIATDLAAAYVHVQLILPLNIRRNRVDLDFSDPRRLGGLHPIGRTMRFAALAAFVALSLYSFLWFVGLATVLDPILPTTARTTVVVFFVLTWTLASVLLISGLYLVHRHMRENRAERLEAIHGRLRRLGADDESVPYARPTTPDEFRSYVWDYLNLARVEQTRTVPLNVAVIWELLAAALFPVGLQLLVTII